MGVLHPVREGAMAQVWAAEGGGPTIAFEADPKGVAQNAAVIAVGAVVMLALVASPDHPYLYWPPVVVRVGASVLLLVLVANLVRLALIAKAPKPTIVIDHDGIVEVAGGATTTIGWDDVSEIIEVRVATLRVAGVKCRAPEGVRTTSRFGWIRRVGWTGGADWLAGEAALPVGGQRLVQLLRAYHASRDSGHWPSLVSGTMRVDELVQTFGPSDTAP